MHTYIHTYTQRSLWPLFMDMFQLYQHCWVTTRIRAEFTFYHIYPVEKETDGKFCGCQWKRCKVCTFLDEKSSFTNKEGSDLYKMREGLHLDCNLEKVIYLITCKKCKKQYLGGCITRFRTGFNNYRNCHRKFCRGHSFSQVSFHAYFMSDGHCGINDWEIILIDKGRNKQETRKK